MMIAFIFKRLDSWKLESIGSPSIDRYSIPSYLNEYKQKSNEVVFNKFRFWTYMLHFGEYKVFLMFFTFCRGYYLYGFGVIPPTLLSYVTRVLFELN